MAGRAGAPGRHRAERPARAVFVLVSLVLAAGLTACGGPGRSAASFCAELKADTGRMSQHPTAAGPGLTSQFSAALGNLGDFTRMLHQLDQRAPDEIRAAMDQTVKAWDDQQQALSQAAQDPAGTTTASLASSMSGAASIRAVDEYAVDNCGATIFGAVALPTGGPGTSPSSAPSADTAASFQCPEDSDVDYSSILANDTTYRQLTGILQDLRHGPAAVARAATAIADGLAKLTPVPSTSLEALVRLRFRGIDPVSLLATLNSAISGSCGAGIWADATVNGFPTLTTPYQLDTGGVRTGGAYGQCDGQQPAGWAPPFDEIVNCGDGTLAVVDLTTGAVTHVTGPRAGQAADVAVAGDKIVWVTVETSASQGNAWTATLHIRDLHGATVADKQIDSGQGDPPDVRGFLNFTTAGHILLDVGGGSRMVDTTGATLWSSATRAGDDTSQPTPSSLVLGSSRLVDIDTGRTLHTFASGQSKDTTTDGCGTTAVVTEYLGATVTVSESAAGIVTVRPVPATLADSLGGYFGVTTTGPVVDSNGYLRGYSRAGTQLWKIPDGTAKREQYAGRWVVVTDPSGARLLVDGATGKDTAAAHPDVVGPLGDVGDNLTIAYADRGSGIAIVTGSSPTLGQVAYQLPYQSVCG